MHGLAVYVKEELPFVRDVSLESSTNSYVFKCLYFTQCHFFFCYRLLSSSLCTDFDAVSSNTDGIFSINPSTNAFVFGDLKSPS